MANFAFSIHGQTLDLSVTLQINDSDAPRILGYLMASGAYGRVTENVQSQVPDASWSPGEGQTEADRPMIDVQQWVTRQATPTETAENYARATLSRLLAEAVEWERAEAARIAAESVPPIRIIS